MPSILKKIILAKNREIKAEKKLLPQPELLRKLRERKLKLVDFKKSISVPGVINCIGELKKASPSRGIINAKLDLLKTAKLYEVSGLRAISVLTDKHFKGELADLTKVKQCVKIPVLRKDFILDEYQLYQSYCAGADAVLLIASILSSKKISRFLDIIQDLGMQAIVEVHNRADIRKIDFKKAQIIGINNRDLNNFKVALKTTVLLKKYIPRNKIIISESGFFTSEDIKILKKCKINAVLIGEGIISAPDIKLKIRELLG
ncbi:MAG: indole-3-glycerol phosphate synthase TrpC [Candidatus Omnitrophota bacterium]